VKNADAISIVPFSNSPECIDFAMRFFLDEEIFGVLPVTDRSHHRVWEAVTILAGGTGIAYIACVDGEPIGMLWGEFVSPVCILGHWGILRKYRTPGLARAVGERAMNRVFDDFSGLQAIMGFTPKNNLAAVAGAKSIGFVEQGIIPNGHLESDGYVDTIILVRPRWVQCR
jgi:RimJ/RimL family protein N-acetyltransferase